MRLRWSWKLSLALVVLSPVLLILGDETWLYFRYLDSLFWPASAHRRIEDRAAILVRIKGPARWCYMSENKLNLLQKNFDWDTSFKECVANIKPVSDFIEQDKDYYIKRFYRAAKGDYFCEVTLSTVRDDDRIVGSDCYYGLFQRKDDKGVGMTDDPFG